MDLFYLAQIQVIIFLQSVFGWLAAPMKLITSLGTESIYLFLIPTIYWCIDAGVGMRFGLIIILNDSLNFFFKYLFHGPRPYWLDTHVHAFSPETSFGIPSGHSQTSSGAWLFMAASYRKSWFTFLALIIIVLIGFSRVFLGSHFISDVLGAWLISSLFVFSFLRIEPMIRDRVKRLKMSTQMGLAFVTSIVVILFTIAPVLFLAPTYVLPATWVQNAAVAYPDVKISSFSITSTFTISGLWFGMLTGLSWTWNKMGVFNSRGPLFHRLVRYFIGGLGTLIILNGLQMISPSGQDWISFSLRYFRYMLIGLWITGFAPLLFLRLKIATFLPRNGDCSE
jgi:membrane-associated phospholipid phosphatase